MPLDLSTIFEAIIEVFYNKIFLIYFFSILITIIGDIEIALKIEDRDFPFEIENTSSEPPKNTLRNFIFSILLIILSVSFLLGFDYFNIKKTIQFIFGFSFLSILYIVLHKLSENTINKRFLTKNSEIEVRMMNEIEFVYLFLSPLKAMFYIFTGIASTLKKNK